MIRKTQTGSNLTRRRAKKQLKQKFPPGWSEQKVRAVIEHYEQLTDDELAREIETAPEVTDETLISVPTELLPAVRRLIIHHQSKSMTKRDADARGD